MTDPHSRFVSSSSGRAGWMTAAEFAAAQHPPDRGAALTLATAQRDLALCRASSAADLVREPGVVDPEAEYAAWLARMIEFERWARESARRSLKSNDEWDRTHDRTTSPLEDVTAFAIRRARSAIALMLGDDETAGAAARADVLTGWRFDDELARKAAGFRTKDEPEGD